MLGFQTTTLKAMRIKADRRGLVQHLRRTYEASYNENPTTVSVWLPSALNER